MLFIELRINFIKINQIKSDIKVVCVVKLSIPLGVLLIHDLNTGLSRIQ